MKDRPAPAKWASAAGSGTADWDVATWCSAFLICTSNFGSARELLLNLFLNGTDYDLLSFALAFLS
jgi:hypothetical protein